MCHLSPVTCQVPCHLSPVTCHLTYTLCSFTYFESPRRFGDAAAVGLGNDWVVARKRKNIYQFSIGQLKEELFWLEVYNSLQYKITPRGHRQQITDDRQTSQLIDWIELRADSVIKIFLSKSKELSDKSGPYKVILRMPIYWRSCYKKKLKILFFAMEFIFFMLRQKILSVRYVRAYLPTSPS